MKKKKKMMMIKKEMTMMMIVGVIVVVVVYNNMKVNERWILLAHSKMWNISHILPKIKIMEWKVTIPSIGAIRKDYTRKHGKRHASTNSYETIHYLMIFHLWALLLIIVMIQIHILCRTNLMNFNMGNIDIHFIINILSIVGIWFI